MGYTEQDWKAINTIRLLAVSLTSPPDFTPPPAACRCWESSAPPSAPWHHETSSRHRIASELPPPREAIDSENEEVY